MRCSNRWRSPTDRDPGIDHLATLPPLRSQKDATRLAGWTIRKIISPLKAMLAEAYELAVIPTDAARVRVVVENSRVPRRRPKTLNREEIAALTSELDPRDHLLVLVLRRPACGSPKPSACVGRTSPAPTTARPPHPAPMAGRPPRRARQDHRRDPIRRYRPNPRARPRWTTFRPARPARFSTGLDTGSRSTFESVS